MRVIDEMLADEDEPEGEKHRVEEALQRLNIIEQRSGI